MKIVVSESGGCSYHVFVTGTGIPEELVEPGDYTTVSKLGAPDRSVRGALLFEADDRRRTSKLWSEGLARLRNPVEASGFRLTVQRNRAIDHHDQALMSANRSRKDHTCID